MRRTVRARSGAGSGAVLGAVCVGLCSLTLAARAGGEMMEPLGRVELYGSVCSAREHRVGGEPVRFVCEFDHTLEAGLTGTPRMVAEGVAAVTLLQRNLEREGPLERQAVQGTVSSLRLYGGTECRHAGEGATLAVQGERLNYTCVTEGGQGNGEAVGLIGPLLVEGDAVLADRVVLARTEDGLEPLRSERFAVEALTIDVEGDLRAP